ncbi:TDP-N-acetylfucosamine:lipid II N-acetylfucosaminyltransferase [Chryseobacterium sp. 09-1422]|uniref:TDP-N-acetylfucosamine:lipid II N-acetylfucosaminyltransferase n=1 Tax=Chryseobacterium kimseyorum TaxID=2984028 RepID=A0ABT3HUQ2_9FLAO|nr:TDP-N-acetylfucosamine:lipid II N-acetylfucosaminyltransferase [Chryseobacterium kimseyorum]MCW3167523.1 TDP-N-acetylfucosamine:lipid II N-acetylfucosaminyltransferase [Chryseobacterium kimseyorum]
MSRDIKVVHFLEATLFTEAFINSFEKTSSDITFYIINNGFLDREYMKKDNVKLFDMDDNNERSLIINSINKNETKVAVFHVLNAVKMEIILSLRKDIRKIWCLWGNDFYDTNYYYPFKLYEKFNLAFFEKDKSIVRKIYNRPEFKTLIFNTLKHINTLGIKSKLLTKLNNHFALDRYFFIKENIDYISYIVPKEKKILSKIFPGKVFCHLYSDPDLPQFHHFKENNDNIAQGNNILLAHSAAETNNHLDCLEILKSCNLSTQKIISPLSYGGSKEYIGEVIQKGKEYFGERFVPLTERLSLEEYSKILSSCSVAMMNQRRQQAGGNLFHLIGSGIKVYLNKENGFYDYFVENGIKVFDITVFKNNFEVEQDLKSNSKKLRELYSEEHFQNQINISLQNL